MAAGGGGVPSGPMAGRRTTQAHRWARALAVAVVATACAAPEIPVVTAPATPTPVVAPTPTVPPEAPTPTPSPFDDEPGVTADTMRLAVIADVEAAEELGVEDTVAVWEATEAWAAAVNSQGGIAGRMVEVVRLDAQVFRHGDAIDQACRSDIFALVGSSAINDSDGLDQLESDLCRLPDFPATVSTIERLRSPLTTVSNPVNGEYWNAGWARLWADELPVAAQNSATILLELPSTVIAGERLIEAATAQGFEFVHRPEIPVEPDIEAVAADLAASGARSLVWRNSGAGLLDLLRALDDIDARGQLRFVDCGMHCYDRTWVNDAGRVGNGVSVWLPTVPFEDAELNRELTRYLFWLGQIHPDAVPTVAGVNAWAAGLLFQAAVDIAVGSGTPAYDPASITRASVIEAANTITEWDARGLHGPSNPAEGIPSACFVQLTLDADEWERVFPRGRNRFDCNPDNLVQLQFTEALGDESEPTPLPVDEGGGDDLGRDGFGGDGEPAQD